MKINQNFLGEWGCKTKNLPWGEYGYFLELRNAVIGYQCSQDGAFLPAQDLLSPTLLIRIYPYNKSFIGQA